MEFLLEVSLVGLAIGGVYALIAVGYALVYRTTRVVNFAHGNMMMFGAYFFFSFTTLLDLHWSVSIIFTLICAAFSILLYFPSVGDVYFALTLFVIANIAFEMGTVFCNSYLKELSQKAHVGKISGFAWGLGFVGGLFALFLCLYLFPNLSAIEIRKIKKSKE